jgi:two-component system chemotaxis response regulator CheY
VLKVMTVDDSSTIRRVFRNTLPKVFIDKIEIVEAEDGVEAMDKLQDNPDVKIIFLDVNMPNMKGDEFLEKMRKNAEYNEIRVIMATTEAEKRTVMRIMKLGANGYIIKPFNFDTIVNALNPIVSRMGIEIREKDAPAAPRS